MAYILNTPEQQTEMLAAIGAKSVEELFEQIPAELHLGRDLEMEPPQTEMELQAALTAQAARNSGVSSQTCFLGGGVYDHFIPAAVDEVVSRGEYYTAYTPYQAEASQGTLQAFFEYQSLICQLTGMDVSNASLYEGGTAVSEAAFMSMRVNNRHDKVAILESVHPEYREVLKTYLQNLDCELVTIPTPNGAADPAEVAKHVDDKTACVIYQHPNFYGNLEPVSELSDIAHKNGAMSVVSFDPLSLGLLKRPADYGADIAVAEGQSLGIPLQYGGPFLGILACGQKFVRKMPGRLIGTTKDRNGNPCYVLNLQAREQHIRRDKATSNICTNQGLLALRATVYMSLMGPNGLKDVAELCCRKAHYAADALTKIDGVKLAFDQPFFKEFAITVPGSAAELVTKVARTGMSVGPALSVFDQASDTLLVAVTEQRSKAEIDRLVAAIAESV